MNDTNLNSIIESILFAADRPVSTAKIKEIFGEESPKEKTILKSLNHLKEKYLGDDFGFEIREAQGGFQFCTKAKNGDFVRRFLAAKPFRLSRTALETLAIIAYRQPITRAEVDQIRGIDSGHIIRVLAEKDVVKMVGKADVPGRPVQYGTTNKFLELIGLNTLNDLPPLSELKELQGDQPELSEEERITRGLDKFIATQVTNEESLAEGDLQIEEIDSMIQSAKRPSQEVHKSQLHAEIAAENEEALEGLKQFIRAKKRSKKSMKEATDFNPVNAPEPEETQEECIEENQMTSEDANPPIEAMDNN